MALGSGPSDCRKFMDTVALGQGIVQSKAVTLVATAVLSNLQVVPVYDYQIIKSEKSYFLSFM